MRLNRLDLNLLLALDALLSLRSVSAAAERLHVSQPAMSGSLRKLREHFEDSLLVQTGRSMQLTPLAQMLIAPVRQILEQVETTISLRSGFDPAVDRRHFALSASEATTLVLLVDVIRAAKRAAPHVTVDIFPAEISAMTEKLGNRELDFIFTVDRFAREDHPYEVVIEDKFKCVVWSGNTRIRKKLTMDQYLDLGHAVTRYGFDRRPGFEQFSLERLHVSRRVEVTCNTPALLGPLVVGTDRIATLPSKLAAQQAITLPLRVLDPPLALPPLRIVMQWHRTLESDGATQWMRELVLRTAKGAALIGSRS
jgi:LysR family nod box-dependent transcriptional activator